jgi:hypothetical protein
MEAEEALKSNRGLSAFSVRRAFFERDFNERRVHQKAMFYRMPFRPLVRFLYSYFVRFGILDGKAGLTYALLQGFYEYLIVLKTRELESGPVPQHQATAVPASEHCVDVPPTAPTGHSENTTHALT